MEAYIVAFKAGSSGRFVANLLWGFVQSNNYEYNLSEFNSTHDFSPYALSFYISGLTDSRPFNNSEIYKHLNFNSYPGVATLHAYPDFDIIKSRLPNTKIVIVSFTKRDIPEIAGNSLLKNGFEKLKLTNYKSIEDHCTSFIQNQYFSEFKESYNGQEIPLEFKKELFKQYQTWFNVDVIMSEFFSPVVPDEFVDQTLIIDYHELCHDHESVLQKLSDFTNKKINDRVVNLYQKYLLGRETLITKHMPWINL